MNIYNKIGNNPKNIEIPKMIIILIIFISTIFRKASSVSYSSKTKFEILSFIIVKVNFNYYNNN